MLDRDEDATASHGTELRRDPRLVGTTGNLYSRTIAASEGAELLAQNKQANERPKEISLGNDESNYFKSAQWYFAYSLRFGSL